MCTENTTLSHLTATADYTHKWFWLHLSALYTVNKGIPIMNCNVSLSLSRSLPVHNISPHNANVCGICSFDSFGCLIIQRLNYDLVFLFIPSVSPMVSPMPWTYECHACMLIRGARESACEEKLKSSVARLLKLTTYWNPLCNDDWSLYTRLFRHNPNIHRRSIAIHSIAYSQFIHLVTHIIFSLLLAVVLVFTSLLLTIRSLVSFYCPARKQHNRNLTRNEN